MSSAPTRVALREFREHIYTSHYRGQHVSISRHASLLTLDGDLLGERQNWHWDAAARCLSAGRGADHTGLFPILECLFALHPSLAHVALNLPASLQSPLVERGLVRFEAQGRAIMPAEVFWQFEDLWLCGVSGVHRQQALLHEAGRRQPRRPGKKTGTLYRRYIPWLGQTLSFRALDRELDLAAFHRWMHDPRVSEFWQQADSVEELDGYLRMLAADEHVQTVIGCFDEVPFAYFEVYWAREDRLAPFYDAHEHDRGWHLLVGENAYRGRSWFTAWFPSLQHYLFLDEPRTKRIVAEPRHDNARLIQHACKSGFETIKTFDFPHKRAQLIMLSRERFFGDNRIHPSAPAAART